MRNYRTAEKKKPNITKMGRFGAVKEMNNHGQREVKRIFIIDNPMPLSKVPVKDIRLTTVTFFNSTRPFSLPVETYSFKHTSKTLAQWSKTGPRQSDRT